MPELPRLVYVCCVGNMGKALVLCIHGVDIRICSLVLHFLDNNSRPLSTYANLHTITYSFSSLTSA